MSTHSNPITNVTRKTKIKVKKSKPFIYPKRVESLEKYSLLELTLDKIRRVI